MLASAASSTPKPKPKPLIAFLNEGNIWATQADGSNKRLLAAAPEREAIQDFVWSSDGSRIYFSIGFQFFEIVIETGNVARAGTLTPPPDAAIERLEMAADGRTILIHLLGPNAATQFMILKIGDSEAHELTTGEYNELLQPRLQIVRNIGEHLVSPDGRQILFKRPVGTGEELFVSDVESGARLQITHLYELEGFEGSVATEGGRRVIEASWSPDGRYVIFNPMQSCSELGLCYGRLFLVESCGGEQLQLSVSMMVNVAQEWNSQGDQLLYEDGSKVVTTDTSGHFLVLGEGNRPKWQPTQ
ncbi:MAG TPA: hypothetical protein VJ302_14190 [Blastocatellia bacterium]|nr:hypothetical protein [Blastocatellia bacterium]